MSGSEDFFPDSSAWNYLTTAELSDPQVGNLLEGSHQAPRVTRYSGARLTRVLGVERDGQHLYGCAKRLG
jgi:hypothetical protein